MDKLVTGESFDFSCKYLEIVDPNVELPDPNIYVTCIYKPGVYKYGDNIDVVEGKKVAERLEDVRAWLRPISLIGKPLVIGTAGNIDGGVEAFRKMREKEVKYSFIDKAEEEQRAFWRSHFDELYSMSVTQMKHSSDRVTGREADLIIELYKEASKTLGFMKIPEDKEGYDEQVDEVLGLCTPYVLKKWLKRLIVDVHERQNARIPFKPGSGIREQLENDEGYGTLNMEGIQEWLKGSWVPKRRTGKSYAMQFQISASWRNVLIALKSIGLDRPNTLFATEDHGIHFAFIDYEEVKDQLDELKKLKVYFCAKYETLYIEWDFLFDNKREVVNSLDNV